MLQLRCTSQNLNFYFLVSTFAPQPVEWDPLRTSLSLLVVEKCLGLILNFDSFRLANTAGLFSKMRWGGIGRSNSYHSFPSAPEVAMQRHEAMMAARMRLQGEVDKAAEIEAEKQREVFPPAAHDFSNIFK